MSIFSVSLSLQLHDLHEKVECHLGCLDDLCWWRQVPKSLCLPVSAFGESSHPLTEQVCCYLPIVLLVVHSWHITGVCTLPVKTDSHRWHSFGSRGLLAICVKAASPLIKVNIGAPPTHTFDPLRLQAGFIHWCQQQVGQGAGSQSSATGLRTPPRQVPAWAGDGDTGLISLCPCLCECTHEHVPLTEIVKLVNTYLFLIFFIVS